jgi:anti-sigma-K factor RskA
MPDRGTPSEAVTPPAPTPGALRASLIEEAPDVQTIAWAEAAEGAAPGASGDVVWSDARQEGYMRFRNFAANDPSVEQYQLWIFDAERNAAYPVDGGVFDVPAGSDEVIVPIRAKLPVSRATLFAITVEKPGGVVVSSRERLPLIAQVEG